MAARVLVLSGGGSKGAWQVGVLLGRWNVEAMSSATSYDAIFGVSTGALSAAVLGLSEDYDEAVLRLYKLYLDLRGQSDILSGGNSWLARIVNLLRTGGMYSVQPLRRLLLDVLGDNPVLDNTHVGVGYTDLVTGEYRVATPLNTRGDFFEKVIASATQPFFMRLGTEGLADGGVRNMTPLADAIRWIKQHDRNATLDVIVTNPLAALARKEIDVTDPMAVLSRTFDIIEREIFVNDLAQAVWRNKHPRAGDLRLNLNVYAPSADLGDGMDFTPAHIRTMLDNGYATGYDGVTQDVSQLA